jgi:hypothetical protein
MPAGPYSCDRSDGWPTHPGTPRAPVGSIMAPDGDGVNRPVKGDADWQAQRYRTDELGSVQALESGDGKSLHSPVSVSGCGGMRHGEQVPGLDGVARSLASSKHPSP